VIACTAKPPWIRASVRTPENLLTPSHKTQRIPLILQTLSFHLKNNFGVDFTAVFIQDHFMSISQTASRRIRKVAQAVRQLGAAARAMTVCVD